MSQKRKSKLPPEWQIYANADRKLVKRKGVALWKYAVWVAVLIALAGIAFFPWSR